MPTALHANRLRLWFASMVYVLPLRFASHRALPHQLCRGDLKHDPSQVPEDRRRFVSVSVASRSPCVGCPTAAAGGLAAVRLATQRDASPA